MVKKKTKSSDVFPEEQPKPVVQKWVLDEIERAKRMLVQKTARLLQGLRQGHVMSTTEVWKTIPEYDGLCEVSNHGRVKSLQRRVWVQSRQCYKTVRERILKPINQYGFMLPTSTVRMAWP